MTPSGSSTPFLAALPSITELERLWYEILREMTDTAKVVKFRTAVAQIDDERVVAYLDRLDDIRGFVGAVAGWLDRHP